MKAARPQRKHGKREMGDPVYDYRGIPCERFLVNIPTGFVRFLHELGVSPFEYLQSAVLSVIEGDLDDTKGGPITSRSNKISVMLDIVQHMQKEEW